MHLLTLLQIAETKPTVERVLLLERQIKRAGVNEKNLQRCAAGLTFAQYRMLLVRCEAAFKSFDKKILADFDQTQWPGIKEKFMSFPNYDFYAGWLAVGFASLSMKSTDVESRRRVLHQLLTSRIPLHGMKAWPALISYKKFVAQIDLGLPHGIFGVLLLLSLFYKHGFEKKRTLSLAQDIFEIFIAAQRNMPKGVLAFRYPAQNDFSFQRMGWCYGGQTAGLSFLIAGHRFRKKEWSDLGYSLLKQQINPKKTLVVDPWLCHGAIGAAYLFHLAFVVTADVDFLRAQLNYEEIAYKMIEKEKDALKTTQKQSRNFYTSATAFELAHRTLAFGESGSWDFCLGYRDPIDWEIV